MWKEFRKNPVVIKAVQFTDENKDMVYNTLKEVQHNVSPSFNKDVPCLIIPTSEGEMLANLNDWIILEPFDKDRKLYPVKPEIFEQTYTEVEVNPPVDLDEVTKKLVGNPDAKVWAEEFVRMVKEKPSIATDEATMIGWFANAIEAKEIRENSKKADKFLEENKE